jgi:hypothetical protein
MGSSIAQPSAVALPLLPDRGQASMAKATVRTPDKSWRVAVGQAIQAAVKAAAFSNKEAAAQLGVDDAEFGKWLNGTSERHPQLDRLFAVDALRCHLVVALARIAGPGVEVVTEIRIREAR